MKKVFLTLAFSSALFVFSSNAVSCIIGFAANQVSIEMGFQRALANCVSPLPDPECFTAAENRYKYSSALNLAFLISCCASRVPTC